MRAERCYEPHKFHLQVDTEGSVTGHLSAEVTEKTDELDLFLPNLRVKYKLG